MTLNEFASAARLEILDALKRHRPPPRGSYDEAALRELLIRPSVQLGATTYHPDAIHIEFVANRPGEPACVFTVHLEPPEPIVFLPVPDWVVEDIWQGAVDGIFCFRSEAEAHLAKLREALFSEANARYFERPKAKRPD